MIDWCLSLATPSTNADPDADVHTGYPNRWHIILSRHVSTAANFNSTLVICSPMKKSQFTVCDPTTQGRSDGQQKIITTNGNRSHAACFRGKSAYSLLRQVGSNPRHLLLRQVLCPLYQWYYTTVVECLNVNGKFDESKSFVYFQVQHVH